MADVTKKACRCCGGSGKELNDKIVGAQMRELRMQRGIAQAEVARRIGYRPPYICDLEAGKRRWSNSLIERYLEAINQ